MHACKHAAAEGNTIKRVETYDGTKQCSKRASDSRRVFLRGLINGLVADFSFDIQALYRSYIRLKKFLYNGFVRSSTHVRASKKEFAVDAIYTYQF